MRSLRGPGARDAGYAPPCSIARVSALSAAPLAGERDARRHLVQRGAQCLGRAFQRTGAGASTITCARTAGVDTPA